MSRKNTIGKKTRFNIIKLLVGLIFLFFSFRYLESHAAERTSLLSGLDMMAERFHVLSYKILGKDYYTLEEKYLLIRRLEDVAITASYVDSCQETLYIEDLYNTIEEIRRKEVDEEFRTEVPLYFSYLFEAQEYVLNECSGEADG